MRIKAGEIEINCEVSGSGTPLVLLHALGSSLHYWDPHVEELARHHRVVRCDLRGFGESDKPSGPYSPELFSDDVAALLDALAVERAHVLGISMGGVVAQRFAFDHAPRLISLIVVSTSSEVGPQALAHWQRLAAVVERQGLDPRVADASRSFAPAFAAAHRDMVEQRTAEALRCSPAAYAAAARAVSDYHWTADLPRIATPTLILQGLEDQLTPPGGSVKMSRALPRSRLLMIPAAGHHLPLEQPLVFRAAVLAFTAGVELHGT